jgi:hypothetical protein
VHCRKKNRKHLGQHPKRRKKVNAKRNKGRQNKREKLDRAKEIRI